MKHSCYFNNQTDNKCEEEAVVPVILAEKQVYFCSEHAKGLILNCIKTISYECCVEGLMSKLPIRDLVKGLQMAAEIKDDTNPETYGKFNLLDLFYHLTDDQIANGLTMCCQPGMVFEGLIAKLTNNEQKQFAWEIIHGEV